MNPLTQPTLQTTPTLLNFPPPLHLKHKAVVMLPYEAFDGPYAGNTDAKYLSLGRAQWNEDNEHNPDISAKVWRYPDSKWSRMSEELPLHRIADLCILMAKVLSEGEATSVIIPAGTFENQDAAIELKKLDDLPESFNVERERITRRLRKLREVLREADL